MQAFGGLVLRSFSIGGNQVVKRRGCFLLPKYMAFTPEVGFSGIDGPVNYAGRSIRRSLFLKQHVPQKIVNVGGGNERDIREVGEVVLEKITSAAESYEGVIVAADTRTEIQEVNKDGVIILVSKGKPSSYEDVRSNFGKLYGVATQQGACFYRVVSASALSSGSKIILDQMQCTVVLKKETLGELASVGGFSRYIEAFNSFYGSQVYTSNGLSNISLTDISGGISLPVLLAIGAVESVDGVQVDVSTQDKEEKLREAIIGAIYTVAVGFSPRIFSAQYPQAVEEIFQWAWLSEVADETITQYKIYAKN